LEQMESYFRGLFEIEFVPVIWALEIVDWNDVIVKLSCLLPVRTDDGSEEKVSDASIIHLNSHLFERFLVRAAVSTS